GIRSDYNLFHLLPTAQLGRWQSRAFDSRAQWFYELGLDQHSLEADPLFVAPSGDDGDLGYDTVSSTDRGVDDDFYLQSLYGSHHGGFPAPYEDPATHLPVFGLPTPSTDGQQSPAIDQGDPASGYSSEPGDNGGRVNLGALGNTAFASHSPAEVLQVLAPNGLEKFEEAETTAITWRSSGLEGVTVDVELSIDSGQTWSTLAGDVPLDSGGQGSLPWLAGPVTGGNAALVRVVANAGQATDVSDAPFLIANSGHDYYVNDATVGGTLIMAPGANANSGKDPTAPMASLAALLQAYDLDAGDVVYVDAGTYELVQNIRLESEDGGVRVLGPPTGGAVLDRNFRSSGYIFELLGADGVTIENLDLTDAHTAVFADTSVDSDMLTIRANRIYAGSTFGVLLNPSNDDAVVAGNEVFDTRNGVRTHGQRTRIEGNTVYQQVATGIYASGLNTEITANDVYANATGIETAQSSTAHAIVVSNNHVYDNTSAGIYGGGGTLIRENTTHGHVASVGNSAGIRLGAAEAVQNVSYDNEIGIDGGNGSIVANNRLFANHTGLHVTSGISSGNHIYSNSIGIEGQTNGGAFTGQLENNLVYANTNTGIQIVAGSGGRLVNNTVVQGIGDALRLTSTSRNMLLRNNILSVDAGYAIFVDATSQTGFNSQHNLLYAGSDPAAHIGFWGGITRDTLAAWNAATGQDDPSRSLEAAPLFVDSNGADNVLGYNGVDGGGDDNFSFAAGSPGIDRGDEWEAPLRDSLGAARRDDPGTVNQGSLEYAETDLGTSQFAATGTPRSFRTNGTFFNFTLPFAFPLYGQARTSMQVSTEGFLKFDGATAAGDGANTLEKLANSVRIAPLWDNIRTSGAGDDIFVDSSVAGQIMFRWNATNEADGSDVNFAVTLFADGRIRYDYGAGNANVTPTIGISRGNDRHYLVSRYDGQANLGGVNSLEIALTPGLTFVDVGAYEFRGSSLDMTPPQVTAIAPAGIAAGASVHAPFDEIVVTFSEPLSFIDAVAAANYELRSDGGNGVFGDANDVIYVLNRAYVIDETTVTLTVLASELADGNYRLTISPTGVLRDSAGIALDGDVDTVAGGAYVRTFTVHVTLPGDFDFDGDVDDHDIDLLMAARNAGTNDPSFDLTGDALVSQDDVDHHVEVILGTQYGDANLDRVVDRTDAGLLARHYGWSAGPAWARGNFNGDQRVDLADLGVLQANLAPASLSPSIVPSPAAPEAVKTRRGRVRPVLVARAVDAALPATADPTPPLAARRATPQRAPRQIDSGGGALRASAQRRALDAAIAGMDETALASVRRRIIR
ncbi:MAG: right-handed parallel beta-helix repeat-containing protein, partial [Pirellulales bacterium]